MSQELSEVFCKSAVLFLRQQALRARVRWFMLRMGIEAAVFWGAALLAGAWLVHWGLWPVAIGLLLVWVYFSIPALLIQLALFGDLLSYLVLGKIFVYPALEANQREKKKQPKRLRQGWGTSLAMLTYRTSPISGPSAWVYLVLCRLPESTHVLAQKPRRYEDEHVHKPLPGAPPVESYWEANRPGYRATRARRMLVGA